MLNKVVFRGHKLLAFPEVTWVTVAWRKNVFNLLFPEVKCISMDFKCCCCQIKWNHQMDCILLTWPIHYWIFFYWKGQKYHVGIFKIYVKSGRTSIEKHHVEIFTLKAINSESEHPLAIGGTKTASVLELWWLCGTEIFQNQNYFSADLDKTQIKAQSMTVQTATESSQERKCFLFLFFMLLLCPRQGRGKYISAIQSSLAGPNMN